MVRRRRRRPPAAAPAPGRSSRAEPWRSFANPAITIGRAFSDTFAGIAPASILPFVTAQVLGAALGAALAVWLTPRR